MPRISRRSGRRASPCISPVRAGRSRSPRRPAPRRRATGTPSPYDLMLDGLATRFVDGFRAGAPTLQRALSEFRRTERRVSLTTWRGSGSRSSCGTPTPGSSSAPGRCRPPVMPARSRCFRSRSTRSRHGIVLAGDLALADTLLAEADSIMAATGDAPMSHARLRLAALQGGDAEALITASIRDATERGEGVLVRHAEDAAATLYAGLGRYDDALAWAQREVEHNPHAFYMTALAGAGGGRGSLRRTRRGPPRGRRALREDRRRAARRGRAASRRARVPSSARVTTPTRSTGRRSRCWPRAAWASSPRAPSCSTASGCAARTAASMLASSCARRTRPSWRWGRGRSRSGPRASCRPPARPCASARVETRDELTPQEAQIARLAAERAHERGDRRPAVPQPAHGRVAPAQGVRASSASAPAGSSARRCRTRRATAVPV